MVGMSLLARAWMERGQALLDAKDSREGPLCCWLCLQERLHDQELMCTGSLWEYRLLCALLSSGRSRVSAWLLLPSAPGNSQVLGPSWRGPARPAQLLD